MLIYQWVANYMWSLTKPRNLFKRYFGSPARKRKAWHRYLDHLADEQGLVIYKAHLSWLLPGAFQDAVVRWGQIPGIPVDRCFLLHSAAGVIRDQNISGATADCGVRYGKSSFFILDALHDSTKPHYVFDSFEGLSQPSGADRVSERGLVSEWQEGDLAVSEAVVRRNLNGFPNCTFVKGWIPSTFGVCEQEMFSMVHVDVDLYEPTKECYEFFWPRLAVGGMMVCDDYGLVSCPGAKRAVDEFFAGRKEKPLFLPTGQALVTKLYEG